MTNPWVTSIYLPFVPLWRTRHQHFVGTNPGATWSSDQGRAEAANHAVRWDKRRVARIHGGLPAVHMNGWCRNGDEPLLYQRKPILRVVMPAALRRRRCVDADYFHDANEINFWVPLTSVWGSNSLWSESSPGLGTSLPSLRAGQAIRFTESLPPLHAAQRRGWHASASIFAWCRSPLQGPAADRCEVESPRPQHIKRGYYALAEPAAHANGEGNRGDGGLSLGASAGLGALPSRGCRARLRAKARW